MDDEIVFAETGMTARDEVRVSAFGLLRCPSCGELAAELLGHHNLILCHGETLVSREAFRGHEALVLERGKPWCECRDGERVELAGWELWEAAANISLADACWFGETQMWRRLGLPV